MFLKKLIFVPLAAAVLSAAVPVLTFALGSSDKDERTVEEILKDGNVLFTIVPDEYKAALEKAEAS